MSYTDVFGNSTLPPSEYGYRAFTITSDITLYWPNNTTDASVSVAKIMDVSCAAGNSIILPDATLVSTGEDFLIRNLGANAVSVKKSDGTLIYTVNAGFATYFYLTDNSTAAGVYGQVAYGVGSSYVDAAVLVGYGIKAISGTLNQAHPVTTSSANTTVDETYRAKLLNFNGGSGTVTLTSVSTLGDDFFFMLRNSGSGTLTIDPNGSQTIDGQTAMQVQPGESLMLFCSGAAWYSVGYGRSTLYQFTQLVKDVTSGGPFTLTSSEAANKLITFIGTPSATVTVNVPAVVSVYYLYNNCSTAQSVIFKTASGTGVTISQTSRAIVLCDGTNIISAQSINASTTLSIVDGSVTNPSINFASQTNTGIYKYSSAGVGISSNGTNVAQFEATRALISQPQDYAKYSTTAGAPAYAEGTVFYDATDHTLAYYNDANGVTINLGQEEVVRVRNATGSTLTDGQVVYVNGATGNRPTVALAQANAEATSSGTIGVVTAPITNGADGYITTSGLIHGLDTSAIAEGAAVYLSPTTAGAFTGTKPTAPNHLVILGYVTRSHATQGIIYIRVDNGYELDELHNVLITTPSNNQVLTYDSATSLWKNKTPPTYGDVSSGANNAFTGANTFYNATGQTFGTATTANDGIIIKGRAGGATTYRVSVVPGTLTASRTFTLPDSDGTAHTTGTTGALGTGLVKNTTSTGALSIAVAGTDYQSPIGTISGIAKGNGANALTAATAGTDYVAPGTATTFTATQDFAASGMRLKGSSTGLTTFSSANASATNYTITFPASTSTVLTSTNYSSGLSTLVANSANTPVVLTAAAGQSIRVNAGGTAWEAYTPASSSGDVVAASNNAFTGANTFYNATGQTFGTATSTQDGIILTGRAGGTGSFRVTIVPGTLTASRALTLPDNAGTILTTGATITVAQGGTGAASLTGILKGNGTSAFTAATAGTDYQAAITATGLLKGAGAGSVSAAVSGTDYQAPIGTISGITKGNGANALTAAVAGTDYAAPGTTTTFTVRQVFSAAIQEGKVAMGANDVNLSSGNYFTKTISGITTLTVSNVPTTGTVASFILDLTNGGSATITWWTGMKWAAGTAPTLTSAGRDVLGFFTHDGGTTWTGLLLGKDVK